MKTKDDLNYVAYKIIQVFERKFPEDTGYIQTKIERLAEFEQDQARTLHWASTQLDAENKLLLCQSLGLDVRLLPVFSMVMEKLR